MRLTNYTLDLFGWKLHTQRDSYFFFEWELCIQCVSNIFIEITQSTWRDLIRSNTLTQDPFLWLSSQFLFYNILVFKKAKNHG
uniref:Uncharacterized protein n=1 Tax=Oryza brachyantha TaxID=4533 RepID=J3MYI2_ORYBR